VLGVLGVRLEALTDVNIRVLTPVMKGLLDEVLH
jgi:hypothetical protein